MDIITHIANAYGVSVKDVELLDSKFDFTSTTICYSIKGEPPITVTADDMDMMASLGQTELVIH